TSQLNTIIEHKRMAAYGIDNLDSIMTAVESDVTLRTLKYNAEGDDTESSTVVAYVLGMILTMLLYMCLLLYGQMVMTSIIEEKTNRVLEIVVSSVKPRQLMIGKICGIGLVAVTQILIWTILIAGASSLLLPSMISPEIASQVDALNANTLSAADATTDIDMLQAVAMLGNVGYLLQLFALLLLFLIGGFMLYAAVYAAIGSSVDNIQDAGQLQSIVIIPVICGIIFGVQAASDPSSTLSVWTSIIPFTSPMVMMARIPFGVPGWEIALSLIVLYLSFFAMVWVAAKIYRVGIFMYGKKPSVKEMIRWIRYN
ncbi:MAG: ABC transporter permease, partial [Muribaculaceae bacterium]|nr:ABC transporter permease [Muribaculaceae bacterium]